MPTIITGLRVSQLSTLSLGSTGTLFYAATTSTNSYKMAERDLYNTMYKLHLSGEFQSKSEDYRFVHKTGDESITGDKKFVGIISGTNGVFTHYVGYSGGNYALDLANGIIWNTPNQFINISGFLIYDNNGVSGISIKEGRRYLCDDNGDVSLDFHNRILTGTWNFLGSSTLLNNQPIITGNRVVYTTGSQNISGNKVFYGDVGFYNKHYGYNVLTFNSGNGGELYFSDNSNGQSLNPTNRLAKDSLARTSIDWGNLFLTGADGSSSSVYDFVPTNNSLNWGAGIIKGDWTFQDPKSVMSISPFYRALVDEKGIVTLDWSSGINGAAAANLRDHSNNIAMLWPLRLCVASNSTTVTLDWNNRGLSGAWTMNKQPIVTGNNCVYITGNQSITGTKTFLNANVNTFAIIPGSTSSTNKQDYIPIGGTSLANASGMLYIYSPSSSTLTNCNIKLVRTNIGEDLTSNTGNSFFHKEASFVRGSSSVTRISASTTLASHTTGESAFCDLVVSGTSIVVYASAIKNSTWTGLLERYTVELESPS